MRSIQVQMSTAIIESIRSIWQTMQPGEIVDLIVPHRDEHQAGKKFDFSLLPKNFEVPNTFSFEGIIRDAMKHECPEAHPDLEELPDEVREKTVVEQGFWKLIGMHVDYETGYIHAMIKKI